MSIPIDRAALPTHQGLTYLDMPGGDPTTKKITFSLFRRGQYTLEYVTATAKQRRQKNFVTSFRTRAKACQRAQYEADQEALKNPR